jgi:uncharacterized protein involved in exopolysaccharide biosynthesis
MTILRFLRLLNKNLNLLLLCSMALAIIVFLFTRNLPKTYESKTEIYTGLASGPSVDALGATRIDWATTSNEFDNLIYVIRSEQTLGEVGEILLTKHLMRLANGDEENTINEATLGILNNFLPQVARDTLIVPGSETMTLRNIKDLRTKHVKNWNSRGLFQSGFSPYSYSAISGLTVRRISNSDLIEVRYSWTDAYICQETLEILNEVFSKKLLELKIGQSNDIVKYFRDQVEEARLDLMTAEEKLKDFRIENKIINYDQQTKNIAGMQSQLESQYQEELRAKAAGEATVRQLENSMQLNKNMLKFNDDLLEKRNRLAAINSEIAKLEVFYNDVTELQKLKEQAQILEAELSNNLSQRFQYSKTKEGVNSASIIQQWLAATLALDATNARLSVLSNRSTYFQNAYNEFSPLGSELGRLERAVGIAEKKYLELNHSLNMALTRQQSESISTAGIVVTVPPKFPLEAIKSKQLLLVLISAVVGFIVPLVLLVVFEFLDSTVRTPVRGEELTGLKLLGAYPDLVPKSEYKNVNMPWLKEKAIGHITQNLRLEARRLEVTGIKPKSILVFSTRNNEGKNTMTHLMANHMAELGKRVLVIAHKEFDEDFKDPIKYDRYSYTPDIDFLQVKDIRHIVDEDINYDSYEFILVEIMGVIRDQYPIELVERFDMAVCVVSAKRSWNKADRFALSEFIETLGLQPRLLVNAVEPDLMDTVLGEIEKSRSALRKFLKAMLTLQFKSEMTSGKKKKKNKKVKNIKPPQEPAQ